jgi:hypothetical protein
MAHTKPIHVHIAALLTLAVAAPGAALAYDQTLAIGDCQAKVLTDSAYKEVHGSSATETGRNSYKVTGLAKDAHNKDHRFNCRIEHREVVSWNVSPEGLSKSDKTAAAVGAGIIGLAAVAAAVALSNDKDHHDKRSAYDDGKAEGSALDDISYLKQECAREVRFHLDRDHGSVSNLQLTHPYLNGRTLTGNGRVDFEAGGHRQLNFTCDFDRRGRIHDGHYSFMGQGYAN